VMRPVSLRLPIAPSTDSTCACLMSRVSASLPVMARIARSAAIPRQMISMRIRKAAEDVDDAKKNVIRAPATK
jgi:hypothetical protein